MRTLETQELRRNPSRYQHILVTEIKPNGKQQIKQATSKTVACQYYPNIDKLINNVKITDQKNFIMQPITSTIFQCTPHEWHTLLPYLKAGQYMLVLSRI